MTNGEAVIEAGIVTKTKLPATTLSEESFFERLHASSPETAASFREFLPKVSDLGIFLQPASKSATLRWESPDGKVFSLGAVDCDGRLGTYSVCWTPKETAQLKLAHEYLRDLAVLAEAKVRETKDPAQWYLYGNSRGSGLKPLRPCPFSSVERSGST